MRTLDLSTWPRREHFDFFRQMTEPFFGVTVTVDCTQAYQFAKERQLPFFLYYLHCSLKAANQLEPFRYRIQSEQVIIHDRIDASPTINRPNGTFGFSYIEYTEALEQFITGAESEIARVRQSTGLELAGGRDHIIHYSTLPWLSFTALSHARHFAFPDSVPKITFGKITESAGKKTYQSPSMSTMDSSTGTMLVSTSIYFRNYCSKNKFRANNSSKGLIFAAAKNARVVKW